MSISIRKNFFFSSILTTANYLFPLLTYPYVSRVLGVSNIGICNFVDSIVTYFVIFSTMGITILGIRSTAQNSNNKDALNKSFNSLFFLNTLSTFIIMIAFIAFYVLTPKMHNYPDLMIFGGFKIIFNYLLIEWFYKGLEEFKYITFRTIVVKCGYLLSVFLFIKNSNDYNLYYLLSVLMIVFNAIINISHARKYINFSLKYIELKQYLKPFLILGLDLFFGAMYTTFNVAYLGFVSNDEQVGYYTTATKLYTISLALFSAFTGVMMPRLTFLYSQGKFDEFKRLLGKSYNILFAFSIPVVIFSIINAPHIIGIISGSGYEGAIIPMQIVMPLMCISGYKQVIILQGFIPLGKNNAILCNSLVGAVVSILMNICLVSTFLASGSALVWVLSEFAGLCVSQYLIVKYIDMHFPWKSFSKYLFCYLPIGMLTGLCYIYIENAWFEIFVSGSLLIIYFLLINTIVIKNEFVISVIKSIQQK